MNSHITAVIIGCELGFWLLIAVGLSARYLIRQPRLGAIVLALVPVLDVVLIAAVTVDLHGGAEVTTVHRIAGLYLGISVAFGAYLVRWADVRFAYLFADGPAPVKLPKHGPEAFRHECALFFRWLVAAAITAVAVLALTLTVADDAQSTALWEVFPTIGVVTVIWLITGPVWELGAARSDAEARS
ncbi:hypothetical protein [Tomitella biformata]|uniref:hypothetical protein n=1 Tax=Tomitella biformata TaxID=630403 RepID=UPI000466E3A9|nr:hypothetical protein [Tomitella biformata]